MISSLEEAMRLLHNWKTQSTLLFVGASKGEPSAPVTFSVAFFGTVTEISGASLRVSGERGAIFLSDLDRASFEYTEPRDRELDLSNREREEATGVTSGTLSARWDDGYSCFFSELRDWSGVARA